MEISRRFELKDRVVLQEPHDMAGSVGFIVGFDTNISGNQLDYELEMCEDGRKVFAFDSQLELELDVAAEPVVAAEPQKPVYVKKPMTERELQVWSTAFIITGRAAVADMWVKELRKQQEKDPTVGVAC